MAVVIVDVAHPHDNIGIRPEWSDELPHISNFNKIRLVNASGVPLFTESA